MRILNLIPSMLGGGAERQVCYLSEGLTALGHAAHVGLVRDGPNTPRLSASGAIVHRLTPRSSYSPSVLWDLCQVIARVRPSVVQTWLPVMDTWGGLSAEAMRTPWVYCEPSSWLGQRDIADRVRRRVIDHASAIVANSEGGASYWRVRCEGRVPVLVVPNAVPFDEIQATPVATRASLGIAEDAELIVFVGRFSRPKNISLLTEVLSQVLRYRPRAAAICCGEGPLLPDFRRAFKARGLADRCLAPGYSNSVWSLMKAADVFISTSEWEGSPNAVIEAMCSGCQIVLTDLQAHRELLDTRSAYFFPSYSSVGGVAALDQALSASPAERAARVARAQHTVRGFTTERMSKAYAELYATLEAAR